jgi:phosphatidylglycerophosphate synthase
MGDAQDPPADRRPIAARHWWVSRRLSAWLARRGCSPNAISLAGMFAGLAAGGCLAATGRIEEASRFLWASAAALIVVRLLANMLDGMVAIELKRASAVGDLFNEIPDRVSDSAILIGLGFAPGGDPLVGCLAALAAMFTAYVRAAGRAAGARNDFRGPMAKQHRMFLVIALCLVGTAAPESATHSPREGFPALPLLLLWLIVAGCAITAVCRIAGIADQLRRRF